MRRTRIGKDDAWNPISMTMTISTIIQILGALLILAPFALAQFRLLGQHSWPYLVPNALGSGILCVLALLDAQWGFVLLEGVWALVSLWGLVSLISGKRETGFSAH